MGPGDMISLQVLGNAINYKNVFSKQTCSLKVLKQEQSHLFAPEKQTTFFSAVTVPVKTRVKGEERVGKQFLMKQKNKLYDVMINHNKDYIRGEGLKKLFCWPIARNLHTKSTF